MSRLILSYFLFLTFTLSGVQAEENKDTLQNQKNISACSHGPTCSQKSSPPFLLKYFRDDFKENPVGVTAFFAGWAVFLFYIVREINKS